MNKKLLIRIKIRNSVFFDSVTTPTFYSENFFFPKQKKKEVKIESNVTHRLVMMMMMFLPLCNSKVSPNGKQSNYFQLTVQFLSKKERKKEIHYEKMQNLISN